MDGPDAVVYPPGAPTSTAAAPTASGGHARKAGSAAETGGLDARDPLRPT